MNRLSVVAACLCMAPSLLYAAPANPPMTQGQKAYAKSAATAAFPGGVKPGSISQIQIHSKGGNKGIGSITPKDSKGKQVVKISLEKLQDHIDAQDGDLGDTIQDEIDKEDAQGKPVKEGSSTLTGASVGAILHEFYHAALGPGGDPGKAYTCEHLGIDRAVAADLCALVKSTICDGQPSDDAVDSGGAVDGMCQQIKYLNDKWEKGAGPAKAQACALAGADSVFPNGVGNTGVTLPTVGELDGHPENAIPDCPCCSVPKAECCPPEGVEDPEIVE